MKDKDQLLAMDTNRLNKYLAAWMDSEYREDLKVDQYESAYIVLLSAGSIERFTGKNIELHDLSIRQLIVDSCKFAVTLNLKDEAEKFLHYKDDNREELLLELVDERDRLECFLTVASRLAEPLINSGDSALLHTLSEVGIVALSFDQLFDKENTEIGTELSEGMQWMRPFIASDLPQGRYWWFYKADEMSLEKRVVVIIIALPTHQRVSLGMPSSVSAAASSNESSLGKLEGEFEGSYNGKPFTVRCFKKSDATVNAEVTGKDGCEIDEFEGAECRFMNNEEEVASCIISKGMGKCNVQNSFNRLHIVPSRENQLFDDRK